ncbi:MAG: DNA-processing protein DprA [bacterium]
MRSIFPGVTKNNELFFDLYTIPGITEFRLKKLLEFFRTPAAVFQADVRELMQAGGIAPETAQAIVSYRRSEETEARITAARTAGVRAISYLDPEFPANLRNVPHMPPVIFIRGDITEADRQAVAVIGTRRPSHYGARIAEELGAVLAAAGVTVVSGLARGIDTYSQRAALKAGGRTIAVLGSGIDIIYPPENRQLAEEIVHQGALVSEFPLGTEPLAMNFPKRNRIISALSRAVVAVEAGEKSGVLNTCAWAQEQERMVFAVPGRIGDERSAGTNRLIKQHARILTAVGDILEWLGITAPERQSREVKVSEAEKPVLAALGSEPVHIDEICEATGLPMQELLSLLFQLEVRGVIKQLPGKFFVRA